MFSKCSAMFLQCSAMYDVFMEEQPGGRKMKITEIYNDVINEMVEHFNRLAPVSIRIGYR